MKPKPIVFTDAELIVQFQNGEIAGFNNLVLRHSKKLLSFLYYRFPSRPICQDASQKFWLSASIKFINHTYKELNHFPQWMRTSAFRLCLNETRNQPKMVDIDLALNKPDSSIDDTDNSINDAKSTLIKKILITLTQRRQDIFNLHVLKGIKFKVIAKSLGVTVGYVKSEYHKIVVIIRNKFPRKK
jgi:RNA polymerase sigma factor (sigma-70 family)